jgi:glycerophosphoryl diester phosphodiesterase
MFIIGHRGARGLKPENTAASLRAGLEADVDMLEFDVRLTKDKVPVLLHDVHLLRTHKIPQLIGRMRYNDLKKRTAKVINPVTTLDNVLKEFKGRVLLNLELKDRGSAAKILPIIKNYIKSPDDWEIFLFSSFRTRELKKIRKSAPKAQLAQLVWLEPIGFAFTHRQINLTAVGFHRLHVNTFTVTLAKKLGLFTYAYTVNRPHAAERLARLGIDGIVTDYPDLIRKHFDKLDKSSR